ncbi:hypothetical protein FTX61_00225 [Nitriliruptoraceae bacterium ZYF776]|nr:hypothetical protein [Profundirhabdus halotolerans]
MASAGVSHRRPVRCARRRGGAGRDRGGYEAPPHERGQRPACAATAEDTVVARLRATRRPRPARAVLGVSPPVGRR